MTTTSSVDDPLVGRLVDGRYQILDRIAHGGMARVYRATDTRLDRLVALKVMHARLIGDGNFAAKFEAEARAAAGLSHPNVISVFDQGNDDGQPYIVMELVRGRTLRSLISQRAPLDPLEALSLLEPVLMALGAAHRAGMIHRDVKPENVLLSEQGQVKVSDFGLARAVTAQTSAGTTEQLMGTLSYLSPELVTGRRADARSDVYSAGIVLFELLTGQKPHTGDTPIQVAYAHVHRDVPPPSTVLAAGSTTGAAIPDYLDALVTRATARDADSRPHDAQVLLTQLRQVASALQDGVGTDPELTQDLSAGLAPLRDARYDTGHHDTGQHDDGQQAADEDATQVVDAASATAAAGRSGDEQTLNQNRNGSRQGQRPSGATDPSTPPESTLQVTALSVPSRPAVPATGQPHPRQTPVNPPAPGSGSASAGRLRHGPRQAPHRPRYPSGHRVRGLLLILLVLLITGIATAIGWYVGSTQLT